MSTRLEYVPATCGVQYLDERLLEAAYSPDEQDVLLLSYDEGIVIVGSKDELLALANRIVHAVMAGAQVFVPEPEFRCSYCDRGVYDDNPDGAERIWTSDDDDSAECDDAPARSPFHDINVDTVSSASRQHMIETGTYLHVGEAIQV